MIKQKKRRRNYYRQTSNKLGEIMRWKQIKYIRSKIYTKNISADVRPVGEQCIGVYSLGSEVSILDVAIMIRLIELSPRGDRHRSTQIVLEGVSDCIIIKSIHMCLNSGAIFKGSNRLAKSNFRHITFLGSKFKALSQGQCLRIII